MIIKLFFKRLKCLPLFLLLVTIDFILWLKKRGWTIFEGWGIHIYIGAFGQGKTCSMVRDAYNICCRYPGMNVITNLELKGFPEGTKISELKGARSIIEAPDNTIVVLDELGTIWNSRDFAEGKTKDGKGGGISKSTFQNIAQCRHRHVMILGTAQHWKFMDILLRRITDEVIVCSSSFAHPFSRMITNRVFDAKEYELFAENPMLPLLPVDVDCFVQTDKLRGLYDTRQMVDTILTDDYIPDNEIISNLIGEVTAPPPDVPVDRKKQQQLLNKIRKGGL